MNKDDLFRLADNPNFIRPGFDGIVEEEEAAGELWDEI